MKHYPVNTFNRKRGRWPIVAAIVGLLLVAGLIPLMTLCNSQAKAEPPTVVIRVDDIQDYAFREGQVFLLDESVTQHVPLSLAVIPNSFGKDGELVEKVKLAVDEGSDVTVHGWAHEDLALLSFREQAALLFQSKSRIKEVLGVTPTVLVPPKYSYNKDTLTAMGEEGYNIVSAFIDISPPGVISNVVSLPATVELSTYSKGTWSMKTPDAVQLEVLKSVQKYGFAVIVTHPQEFIEDGKLSEANAESYLGLLAAFKDKYSFKNMEELGQERRAQR